MVVSRKTAVLVLLAEFVVLVSCWSPTLINIACSPGDDCNVYIPNSGCTDGQCKCNAGFTPSMEGYYCEKIHIGTMCDPAESGDAFCDNGVTDAECDETHMRCTCPDGRGLVEANGQLACVVAFGQDSACTVCVATGGVCLDTSGDGSPDECGCPPYHSSSSLADGCDIHEVPTGGCCEVNEVGCSDPKAACRPATDLSTEYFCQCDRGYITVPRPYDPVHGDCRLVITKSQDATCTACEDNAGICYDDGSGNAKCLCPATRSSSSTSMDDACDTNHFVLDCEDDVPSLCFIPGTNPYYQYVSGQLKNERSLLYMRGFIDDPSCHFVYDSDSDEFCIDVDIDSTRCGFESQETKKSDTYSGWAVLQYNRMFMTTGDLCLHTYCRYDRLAQVSTSSVEVAERKQIASHGDVIRPETMIKLQDKFGADLLNGDKLGSQVRLVIDMTDDKGVYTAMRAIVCVASNSLNLQLHGSESVTFVMNGCPEKNDLLPEGTGFYPDAADSQRLKTGYFALPKFASGDYIFFHCAVRVCIDETECEDDCSVDKRRRRSAGRHDVLPSSLHQLTYKVKRATTDKSMYDANRALESPDLEQNVVGIRVRDDDQTQRGPDDRPRQYRPAQDYDQRRYPDNYGAARPAGHGYGYVEDYYRGLYDRRPPVEALSGRSDSAVMVISIVVSCIVTLVVTAVLFLVFYWRPRRQRHNAKQAEADMS